MMYFREGQDSQTEDNLYAGDIVRIKNIESNGFLERLIKYEEFDFVGEAVEKKDLKRL